MYSGKDVHTAPCPPSNTYMEGNIRIQFITDRFVRFEWQENARFEDRQTLAVVNRNIMPVDFTVENKGGTVLLKTNHLKIELTNGGEKLSADNLKVNFKFDGRNMTWQPGSQDSENLGATIRTLDLTNGDRKWKQCKLQHNTRNPVNVMEPIDLGKGFISRSGFLNEWIKS